jgi:hypothetical protein
MARRSKDDTTDRRTVHVGFYVTPIERAELDERAAATGRSLSDFARLVLLSDAKKPAPTIRDPAAIRALAVEISRVGNNLNQLTAVAHSRRDTPHLMELREVLELVAPALEKVIGL